MHALNPSITVSIARTSIEVNQALAFCGSQYERTYGTHWAVPPDFFFVAKREGQIVATGGLTLAARHEAIASERYYKLTPPMIDFIDKHRHSIAEFGRFASTNRIAAKAIFNAVISYCMAHGVEFLFAWANSGVYQHTTEKLGVRFWPIDAPLDLDAALGDRKWVSEPLGFFVRQDPPRLHLGVTPFWDLTNVALSNECRGEARIVHQSRTDAGMSMALEAV